MTTPEQNKALTIEFFETVFQKHDLKNVDRFMLESYIQHNPDCPQGMAGFLGFFEMMFKAIPDFRSDINMIVADNDLVIVYNTASGTHDGEVFIDIPPSGNKLLYNAVDIFRFDQGKFAEHWDVADTKTFFGQLGVLKDIRPGQS